MVSLSSAALSARLGRRGGRVPAGRRVGRHPGAAFTLLSPWLIGIVGLTLGPMIASLVLSFTDYDLLSAPTFVGGANYARMLDDPRLAQSLGVTSTYVAIAVPLKTTCALLIAVVLARGVRLIGVYRAAFYLPSLLGASVAIAILWRLVFGSDGIFNAFLGMFGVEGQSWVSTPDTALFTLIALSVWQFGGPMVIFLAALLQVPAELQEAAAIDGAGPVRRFARITVPLITPVIFFNLVLEMINSFQTFTPSYIISGGTGGPADSTLLYSLYLYLEAFTKFRMGYASAMAWVLLLIIGLVTALLFWTSRRWVFYADSGER
ncbi:binding-protein-dependent transport systems inner membrane component [Beutenbergia cavernae DSM 12333]|uniref:Binding-protein-dependent transport systems inner membrane component n=1 Tax=Beutenbergia cavernae (strain ATCC BAA-8 / DSM 12333 / CCUG 43141 / JCM 11478 / NBRC 16432 / NCIMB 13614 / HKI 0122) TaxID=471853 RepID=C5BZK9_BEUC1|nr:sugar ABC transporter permease [Beutenbergia cavernae]ACQ79181.1 binding-protein-dependent transport systems inner membrane component [Beutenbergia cavernae DSM 12333]